MKVKDKRIHRKIRIRKKISGTSKVPRLAVFKSNNNIYVQAIDDLNQVTIASASTLSKEVKTKTLSVDCLLYTSPSPRDEEEYRMPSSA